jgi:hypothetical protein
MAMIGVPSHANFVHPGDLFCLFLDWCDRLGTSLRSLVIGFRCCSHWSVPWLRLCSPYLALGVASWSRVLRETAAIASTVLAVLAAVARWRSTSRTCTRAARAAFDASRLAIRVSTASLLTVHPSESIAMPLYCSPSHRLLHSPLDFNLISQ